jgi:hypothetical protein
MQPKARKKSHRGIRRSEAPCSASNNHRVADESQSMIANNYDTNAWLSETEWRYLNPSAHQAQLLLIWSFNLRLGDPAGHLRRSWKVRAIPSAAERLNQLHGCGHRLGAKRSQVLLIGE